LNRAANQQIRACNRTVCGRRKPRGSRNLRCRSIALHPSLAKMTWLGKRSSSRIMSRITAPVGEVTTDGPWQMVWALAPPSNNPSTASRAFSFQEQHQAPSPASPSVSDTDS
jgi:hypothetical protein